MKKLLLAAALIAGFGLAPCFIINGISYGAVVIMLAMLPFIFLAVIVDDGLPIFYTQIRSGRRGEPWSRGSACET